MTPSRSGTQSRPKHQRRPPAARRYRQTANSGSAMKVTFCVRGVSSPLLANLFLHYAFDLWMRRNELSPNLGDGLRDQAAAVWDCEDAGLAATSIPSVNLTP